MSKKKVVVIGGGTAGFLSAQSAAQNGGEVIIVEIEKVGGICPNWGCIPMCFMDHCVDVIRSLKTTKDIGINIGKVEIDYSQLIKAKNRVVKGIVSGMEARLGAVGIEVIIGSAKLLSPEELQVTPIEGKDEIIRADKIIIASGSEARRYEVPGNYGPRILTAKELLSLDTLPESVAIIGRSVTALELAAVWANLGSEVSLITRKPRLIPNEDRELAEYIRLVLEEDGVKIYTGDIDSIENNREGVSIRVSGAGNKQVVSSQYAVFALGQQPRVDNLGLEDAGVLVEEGRIKTNQNMETNVEGIYAVGDATGEMMLASVAMVQGMVAGINAMGGRAIMDYRLVPRSIRTIPSISAVGITEDEAGEKGLSIKVGKFPFEQNPRANIIGEGRGFVKIIADETSGEILGVHIIGPQAPELIHEAAAIMHNRGTPGDIAAIVHGHPSLHETIQRAAQSIRI